MRPGGTSASTEAFQEVQKAYRTLRLEIASPNNDALTAEISEDDEEWEEHDWRWKVKYEKEKALDRNVNATSQKKREEAFDDEEDVEAKKKAGKTAKKKATNELLGDFGKNTSTPKKLNDIEAEIERLSKLAESAPKESEDEDENDACSSSSGTVSYTHLTLPTICSV